MQYKKFFLHLILLRQKKLYNNLEGLFRNRNFNNLHRKKLQVHSNNAKKGTK